MAEKTQYWLMKSEPDCYSIDDLKTEKRAMWDGVRNYQVRNMMRDDMQVGDEALFYHSNSGDETGVVGVMRVVKGAYPDPTQFDPKSEHPDPKSDPDNPRWLVVDVRFVRKLPRTVTLQEIKQDEKLSKMVVAQKGSRLSVTPVKKTEFDRIITLANKA